MTHDLLLILTVALVTLALRALPFLIFPDGRPVPGWITALGKSLPGAVMGMLIIYCLKNVSLTASPHGLPELISIALVVLSYLWKRSTLLSVLAGTLCYMLLIQLVFV